MKKLLSLFLVLGLALLMVSPVLASDTPSMKIYFIAGSASAGTANLVPLTTIVPGKSRILGWDIGPITSGSGTVAGSIHDVATAAAASSSNQFGELAGANTTSQSKTYAYPRDVSLGVVVLLPTGANATIYYENTIPL